MFRTTNVSKFLSDRLASLPHSALLMFVLLCALSQPSTALAHHNYTQESVDQDDRNAQDSDRMVISLPGDREVTDSNKVEPTDYDDTVDTGSCYRQKHVSPFALLVSSHTGIDHRYFSVKLFVLYHCWKSFLV